MTIAGKMTGFPPNAAILAANAAIGAPDA